MATFTNFATLSYSGGTATSNTVTGELQEALAVTKTALRDSYTGRDNLTYVISLVNSDTAALTGLTITDDLGAYTMNGQTLYPLGYVDGTVRYYVNGVLQADPVTTAGPPLAITGINVPAGGNAVLVYETDLTGFAPLDATANILNTATVTGGSLAVPVVADATISAGGEPSLSISKNVSPTVVAENGQLTYTFVISNTGNTEAAVTDNVVLRDTFDPILNPITVSYNGTTWTEGTNYTYNEATGEFATLAGQITIPAATYTRAADGTVLVAPGTATVVVTGTV